MKPTINIAETIAPDGAAFRLCSHDGEFFLYMNERQVMSTTMTHSELLLADLGCDFRDARKDPRIAEIIKSAAPFVEIRPLGEFEDPEWVVLPPGQNSD